MKQLLQHDWVEERDLSDVDERVRREVDEATDGCVEEPLPQGETALPGVYVNPPAADRLWFRSL